MMSARGLTRRRFLGGGAGAVVAAIAGCSSQDEPPTGSPSGSSVFEALSFEGPDLVVDLVDDHAVSAVNLIGPDGGLFGQTDVPEGATVVRIELLDIKPEGAGFKHYTPGEHELVAVGEDASDSMAIDLVPGLRIASVEQYREGTQATDYGKIIVEIENAGTGPTWVYDVTYDNAPNYTANSDLGGDPGALLLEVPELPEQAIVQPGESQAFIGQTVPLVFREEDPICTGEAEMSVRVGAPIASPLSAKLELEIDGKIVPSGLISDYTCTNVALEVVEVSDHEASGVGS